MPYQTRQNTMWRQGMTMLKVIGCLNLRVSDTIYDRNTWQLTTCLEKAVEIRDQNT